MSCLTNVQGRVERREDAVNDITRSVGKGIHDIIGLVMGACEDGRGKCDRMSGNRGRSQAGRQG